MVVFEDRIRSHSALREWYPFGRANDGETYTAVVQKDKPMLRHDKRMFDTEMTES